ncbi:hypothetical protein [Streptomyces sp. NPDC046985]|uniref:hypothetical protein n=1 Tax=Streptomyces sp. NPDC046985 TaxID=3155377 RepID=UPI003410D5FC
MNTGTPAPTVRQKTPESSAPRPARRPAARTAQGARAGGAPADAGAASGEQLLLWTSAERFPGELLPGESAVVFTGEAARERDDFEITSVHGHRYRLTRSFGWRIARMPFAFSPSNGGYCWIGWDPTLAQALEWMRWDSASRHLAAGRWKRWGHLVGTVPFSLDLDTQELEDGVLRVSRYGRQGLAADYPWGWETRADGSLPESPNRRSGASGRLEYAAWCLTRQGFDDVPTDRLEVVRSYWSRDTDCATGGPNHLGSCKRTDPQFLVRVHGPDTAVLGTVVLCAQHLGNRLGGSAGYYRPSLLTAVAQQVSGRSWLDWQDRLTELTWDLVVRAVDRGLPVPDVAQALREEALAEGERRAAQAAKKAAKEQKLPRRAQEAAAQTARAGRYARRAELIAQALAAEAEARERIRRETDEMSGSI